MYKIFLFAIIILVIGCAKSNDIEFQVEMPPISDKLEAKVLTLKEEVFKLYDIAGICNKYILLIDQAKDPYFRVLDYATETELYNWGKKGNGPDEISDVTKYVILNNNDNNDCRIELFDVTLGEVLAYQVTDTSFTLIEKFRVDYDNRKSLFNNIKYISNGNYSISYDIDSKNKKYLMISRQNSDTLFSFGSFEGNFVRNNSISSTDRSLMRSKYWESTVVTDGAEKFFAFGGITNRLDVFNTSNGLHLKRISILDNYTLNNNINDDDVIYRHISFSGNKRIYAVGIYRSLQELMNIGIENALYYLEEWDYSGTPIRRFELDRPIEKATILRNNIIVAYSSSAANQLYIYKIP